MFELMNKGDVTKPCHVERGHQDSGLVKDEGLANASPRPLMVTPFSKTQSSTLGFWYPSSLHCSTTRRILWHC